MSDIYTSGEILYNPLSYGAFLDARDKFRRSGGKHGDEYNTYDVPSLKFFKIFFYFLNGSNDKLSDALSNSTGLLAPTWQLKEEWDDDDYWNYTSAWAFLKMNDEGERADLLEKFITLLSNINTYSPWYFNSINGLSEALNRSSMYNSDEGIKINKERKKITIKCLPDAYDNRISSLIDLYKTIAFSWQLKKDILPANLRKFDMGIYVFEAPIKNLHGLIEDTSNDSIGTNPSEYVTTRKYTEDPATIGIDSTGYLTSYKYIEFHNCEFDLSNGSNAYDTLNNADGTQLEHTINIFFDDCYERSYNEFLMRELGDVVGIDTLVHDYDSADMLGNIDASSAPQQDNLEARAIFDQRSNIYSNQEIINTVENKRKGKSFLKNAVDELVGSLKRKVNSKLKNIYLGNLFSFSISRLGDQLRALKSGHIWTTIDNINDYTSGNSTDLAHLDKPNGNLYSSQQKTEITTKLGNLYKAQSVANNI